MDEKEKALERLQKLSKAWNILKAQELPDEYMTLLHEFERLATLEIQRIGKK